MSLILALLEDPINATQVKSCLEKSQHQVLVATTFLQAKALLAVQEIDLIISDVHLQNGGDVFDFLKWSKNVGRVAKIPFVLFSFGPTPMAKYLSEGLRISARILGAVRYIEMQNFETESFREQIDALLPEREARRQLPRSKRTPVHIEVQ
ncbi:hypothetical protein BH10CYA1_BH10CYA1_51780 [soil metagenome]